ncbi:marine proteobacterial sortase target protein [Colwellia hornerae]|uniref:Marine proteobacterial sortase target protein n=1 Tax=Colwellia hornerae TaxID=89402 RepID=A0A5C6QRT4_9GAMM|nr:marine proteobacterial sortase target protein [Colwellia hornerae]TWX57728.1 marine proteobacterial sortase target protein [Colwellia hornerae]TWX62541.1 marine proteobacterial sortase target protein [Colwellia hornerae]TWX71453.1 marine proteobacterial sortase target protein [Colwellia hornerae]
MFISRKNRQFIDYQDSYYYRQQYKKRRNKWLKLSLLVFLILLSCLAFVRFAQSSEMALPDNTTNNNTLIKGPQLLFDHPNPARQANFPIDIQTNVEINGLIAYVEIKQTFVNPHAIALEGTYQFPLPEDAAIKRLMIKVGDNEIVGEIMAKSTAKVLYQQAKSQGKKASLLVQQQPNLFINKIANIPPQASVIVTLTFMMPVSFSQGKFDLRLPLAMTKRYQAKLSQPLSENPQVAKTAELTEQRTAYSANKLRAQLHTSTIQAPSHLTSIANSQSSINITLNSGIAITAISSASHKIVMRALNADQNAYFITLNQSEVVTNKSFVLSWQLLASEQAKISSFTEQVSDEYYTLLTFFPPKTDLAQVIARDIIFIIDTSGSMQGSAMEQAKASLLLAILQLNDKDSFNIIAFNDTTELLFAGTKVAASHNIKKAQQFINHLTADGGTEMYRPLSNALMMKKSAAQIAQAIRQIVFITDGAVANEFELMQLLENARGDFRLYTVGIGAAPNGYFMKKAAQFGRGRYVFIQSQNDVQQKMSDFMTKISQPAITNIDLIIDSQVHQHLEVYPKSIPDLYFDEPLQIAIKSQFPITSLQLTGNTVTAPWYQELIIDSEQSSTGISSLWARRKIESLLDSLVSGADQAKVKFQVMTTSLKHQIISPYTSFIALEKQQKDGLLLAKNSVFQAHESLMVAMPKTALGWKLQFLLGMALLLLVTMSEAIILRGYQCIKLRYYP